MDSRPTLVVLHGHDSNRSAAADLATELDPRGRFIHLALEGPLPVEGGGRAWFANEPGSLAAAGEMVRRTLGAWCEDTGTDLRDLVVVGWSQGGAAALAALAATPASPGSDSPGSDSPGSDSPGSDSPGSDATGPHRARALSPAPQVRGLIVLSGFLAEDPTGEVRYDWNLLSGTPVLLQHGTSDEDVPAFFAEDLAAALSEGGVDATFQQFPMGHERSPDSTTAARAWLDLVLPEH